MKAKKTILCVDSNEQHLSIRKVILETRGYQVYACSAAREGLERFQKGGIDLVLSNLNMPEMDGAALIERVKALSPETPTILFSRKMQIYQRETRADLFLPKGAHASAELLERIRLMLVRKRGPKKKAALPAQEAEKKASATAAAS